MKRIRTKICRVCGLPATGTVCIDCHHRKSNKGRYKTPLQAMLELDESTQLDVSNRYKNKGRVYRFG